MDKETRQRLRTHGYNFMRERINRKGLWQVCVQTPKGGWTVWDDKLYIDKKECTKAIETIVSENEKFIYEE